MPFYRELITVIAAVLVNSDQSDAERYVTRDNGLRVDRVITLTPSEHRNLKIVGTPTLMLLERGTLKRLWSGKLSASAEGEVMASDSRWQI